MGVADLTPVQEVFVDMVRNAMMTGFLHLTEMRDAVIVRSNASRGTNESAADVLKDVLGDEPRNWLLYRPFEVTEILDALAALKETYTKDEVRELMSQVALDFYKDGQAGTEIIDLNGAIETYLELGDA